MSRLFVETFCKTETMFRLIETVMNDFDCLRPFERLGNSNKFWLRFVDTFEVEVFDNIVKSQLRFLDPLCQHQDLSETVMSCLKLFVITKIFFTLCVKTVMVLKFSTISASPNWDLLTLFVNTKTLLRLVQILDNIDKVFTEISWPKHRIDNVCRPRVSTKTKYF